MTHLLVALDAWVNRQTWLPYVLVVAGVLVACAAYAWAKGER
jgi:hypothetical protein